VLRVDALFRSSWMGRMGEDAVALGSLRCEFWREGAASRRKLLFIESVRSRTVCLKLLGY